MRIGYARVSTLDQSPDLQLQALTAAGCEKVYGERASGGRIDRPELSRVSTTFCALATRLSCGSSIALRVP